MISLAVLLLVLVAVVGSGVMSGLIFWFTSRLKRLESKQEAGETGLLSSHLDELSAEISAVREQLDRLEQRTEFHERLLEGRPSNGAPELPPAPETTRE